MPETAAARARAHSAAARPRAVPGPRPSPPPSPRAARARTRTEAGRSVAPRRVSGPLRPAPTAAPPLRRGGTGAFERLRALPETRVVDGLLRGRAWIWLIGLLLGGIVAMQVSLLKLNAGISRAVTTAGTLERANADLEAEIGQLSASERVRATALEEGMITPAAGDIAFLPARPRRDARLAARRMQPPSNAATAVMQNFGREPGVVASAPIAPEPALAAPETADSAAPTAAPTATTPDPAAVATPAPALDTGAVVAPGQG